MNACFRPASSSAHQERQGFQIACPEEVALVMRWIDEEQCARLAAPLGKSAYGQYLLDMVRSKEPWRSGDVAAAAQGIGRSG
jgi:dTDP-glucose pyrophosphorylase